MPDHDRAHRYRWGRIFCLEGSWDDEDVRWRGSVLPVLQLLEAVSEARFVHKDIGTRAELSYYLQRWIGERLDYRTLYLACHGTEEGIEVDPAGTISLDELGEELEGELEDCVIHFGACSVMRSTREIDALLERTGARAATGYTGPVEWVDSAAMDMIVLGNLAYYEKLGNALNRLETAAEYASLRRPPVGFRVRRHPRDR